MTRTTLVLVATAAILTILCATAAPQEIPAGDPRQTQGALTHMERDILRVCEGVLQLFAHHADDIWPGYDLAEQPFLVYIPGQFALLMNCGDGAEGFEPYPENWPTLGGHVCYADGQVGNLVGQLTFGYDAGGVQTVAVGFPESLPETFEHLQSKMLGYIVHEAFHEYQNGVFGETKWAREQKYPIEDVENAALAYLEMALLMGAVEAAWADDAERVRETASQFVAVRAHRWGRADSFIEIYEGGEETLEGTARYVELRCLDLARVLAYESSMPEAPPLRDGLAHAALPGSLLDDFRDSMVDGAVPIEDLPRNRIYPVASAQAFLLDYLGVDWKPEVERSTRDFTYARLLAGELGLREEHHPALLELARTRHDYPKLLAAAGRAVVGHRRAYEEALAVFEGQSGTRVEVAFDSNGLYRSRLTSATRLVVDRGVHELCDRYDVYTLERDETFFELHDVGVLEVNDYDGYRRTVVLYAPSIDTITVDGNAIAAPASAAPSSVAAQTEEDAGVRAFSSVRIVGDCFELTHDGPGTIAVDAGGVVVDLTAK